MQLIYVHVAYIEWMLGKNTIGYWLYVTRFTKTRHNDAFLKILIFVSVSSIYVKLCFVVMSMLYCKYISSYKAR